MGPAISGPARCTTRSGDSIPSAGNPPECSASQGPVLSGSAPGVYTLRPRSGLEQYKCRILLGTGAAAHLLFIQQNRPSGRPQGHNREYTSGRYQEVPQACQSSSTGPGGRRGTGEPRFLPQGDQPDSSAHGGGGDGLGPPGISG